MPAEAELCNAVGITEEEYWYFVGLTEAYNGERPEGYELIPDVRCDLVTVVATLAIGLALTAAAAALTPKPRAPKVERPDQRRRGSDLQTESVTGRQRFTPTNNFSSVQETATLGETIPLVYARKGVRVSSKLLWSQLLSYGTGQQLAAVMLFSHGPIGAKPAFSSFAIGDTLLENYTNAKLKLYWRNNGGRVLKGDAYPEGTLAVSSRNDVFTVRYDSSTTFYPYFCGARNPNAQVEFGVYNPMPNGMKYKLQYEIVLELSDAEDDVKKDQSTKRRKILANYPHRAAITSGNASNATYTLSRVGENPDQYLPWGTQDVRSATAGSRIAADEALTIGEQYLIGNSLAVCTNGSTEPWDIGIEKTYTFRILEGGQSYDIKKVTDTNAPYAVRTIQRVAIGTVTNNRSCDATEIGIKSTVYRRLNGTPNFNSHPPDSVIRRYEDQNANIQLGQISTYIDRFSFFYLQARPIGGTWKTINGGTVFAVKGRTPQPQYNYIRINHPLGQYEFRMRPYAGNQAYRSLIGKNVFLLRSGSTYSYTTSGYEVTFDGIVFKLTEAAASNTEWLKGSASPLPLGDVVSFNRNTNGISVPRKVISYGKRGNIDNFAYKDANNTSYFTWDGNFLGTSDSDEISIGGFLYRRLDEFAFVGFVTLNKIEKLKYTTEEAPSTKRTVSATRGSGAGLRVSVETWNNGAARWSIVNGGKGYRTGEQVWLPLKSVNSNVENYQVIVTVSGKLQSPTQQSFNPFDAISDYWIYDSEQSSHQDGPEHSIAYVNEIVAQGKPAYNDLALGGIRINASTEWNSFTNFSAYLTQGIQVRRLINDNGTNRSETTAIQATNLFPEIAYDLLTDDTRGAGEFVGASQVDRERMQLAAKFCRANGFTWDGAITENLNLREFIFEMAAYHLLDFTIIGGRFSLVPSVPYDSGFKINQKGKPDIKALFTDGNIRDLKVSFLSPEERQMFKATVLWREDKTNGFPRTRVFTSRLRENTDSVPEETFDISQFCTSQQHAQWFARFALMLRKYVDHSVTFQTTPQAAMGLIPGEYFRLVSHATHTSRFDNGSINRSGQIYASTPVDDNTPIIYWKQGTEGVKTGTIRVSGNRTEQTELWNSVFTINNTTTTNRVYKLENLEYGEDGLVAVTGSYVPLTDDGTIEYLDWSNTDFVETAG